MSIVDNIDTCFKSNLKHVNFKTKNIYNRLILDPLKHCLKCGIYFNTPLAIRKTCHLCKKKNHLANVIISGRATVKKSYICVVTTQQRKNLTNMKYNYLYQNTILILTLCHTKHHKETKII